MSPEELLPLLAPIRVPAEFARIGARDLLALAALGILCGLAVSVILTPFTARRRNIAADVRASVARLRGEPAEARLAGLSALRAELDPDVPPPEGLRDALYDPAAEFDPAELEKAVLVAARRRR